MPGTPLEQNSSEVSKGLQPEDPQSVQQREEPIVPAREITQTDKLNKRLLVSFLNRMNSQTASDQQANDKSDEEADSDTSFD